MPHSTQLRVTPVTAEDFSAWLPYWQLYQQFYKVNLSQQITAQTWQRFFDEHSPVYCAVARQGEQVLGFVHYVFHASTWAVEDFCYLEDLFVAPEARGQQVGKHLIEYVQQQAREQHCARLYWHTQESNKTAQRLYDWVAEKPGVIEYRMPL
ncbi:GNAT family N-acetyltransferase [Acinetobacter larvae]|uniref:GNAT family N-acetyltransferase n=1 Tax=Acinetobacter larvae TaxID=1789224 RepID=A0A1B2M1H4_9GAMM|nr:GNAT family N-acetyltransferase [Acinetobacter larvae]AOA59050.1 GNAT family N-acetyltransferase [Acinetobacter larvae]